MNLKGSRMLITAMVKQAIKENDIKWLTDEKNEMLLSVAGITEDEACKKAHVMAEKRRLRKELKRLLKGMGDKKRK